MGFICKPVVWNVFVELFCVSIALNIHSIMMFLAPCRLMLLIQETFRGEKKKSQYSYVERLHLVFVPFKDIKPPVENDGANCMKYMVLLNPPFSVKKVIWFVIVWNKTRRIEKGLLGQRHQVCKPEWDPFTSTVAQIYHTPVCCPLFTLLPFLPSSFSLRCLVVQLWDRYESVREADSHTLHQDLLLNWIRSGDSWKTKWHVCRNTNEDE